MALTPQKAKPFVGPLARTRPSTVKPGKPKRPVGRPPAKATNPRTPGRTSGGTPNFGLGESIWDTQIRKAGDALAGAGEAYWTSEGNYIRPLLSTGQSYDWLARYNDQGRMGQDPLSSSNSIGEVAQTVMYDVLGHYGVSNFEFNEMVGLDPFDRNSFIDQWAESVIPAIGTPGGYPDMRSALRDLEAYTKKVVVDYKNATGATMGGGGMGTEGLTSEQVEKMIQDAMNGSFDPGQAASSYYY